MMVQVTTEAVGRYSPEDQRAVVRELGHDQVSIALREMSEGQSEDELRSFYHWASGAGIGIQHILYTPREIRMFENLVASGVVPSAGVEMLFVLGQYSGVRESRPGDLSRYLHERRDSVAGAGWAVCAFGRHETECLVKGVMSGGKARIGFENNLFNLDGSVAAGNAERVAELVRAIKTAGSMPSSENGQDIE